MNNEQIISMTTKEAKRYDIIKELISGKVDGTEASKQMSLSVRQVKRIKARVKKLGMKGVIHASRGRESNQRIDEAIAKKAKELIHEKYYDFNPLLATEYLLEDDGIKLSKETVRKWMIEENLWKAKKKKAIKKHVWRERKDNYGEMEQFDGSYHNWFEGRNSSKLGQEQCLLLSVDDATGKITHAKFAKNEGVEEVFRFWKEYFEEKGFPVSIYLDRGSTYKVNNKNILDDKKVLTQFQRAMNQSGVRVIHAKTPQAKGRVEKMNGTLQRRLIKEMRLRGINTVEEANKHLKEVFIPKFNARFGVIAKKKGDLHKKLNKKELASLDQILSIQNKRVIANDYTIRFKNNYYQLEKVQPTTVYKRDIVIMEEHLDGSLKIALRDHYLKFFKLPSRPKKEIDIKLIALTKTEPTAWKPPANHPWRTQFIGNKKRATNLRKE